MDWVSETKILLFDIEASMAKVYAYDLFRPFISHKDIIEPARMIAFSAKWYGKKGTKFYSEYHHSRREMLDAMHAFLDEADVVVGYNSKRYDTPYVTGELLAEGYTPPSPYKQVDLYQVVKKNSRFLSKKLDYVSERLLDDHKHEYSMAEMWRIVDNPNTDEETRKREWNKMKRYAVKDTNLLEPLMDKLLPWINLPHPRTEIENACRNCGSEDLERRGYALTLNGKYPRQKCRSCGTWQRGTTRIPVGDTRSIS